MQAVSQLYSNNLEAEISLVCATIVMGPGTANVFYVTAVANILADTLGIELGPLALKA